MQTLLVVGRHLLHTTLQARFLRAQPEAERVVFAVTSANHHRSRYNPLPFYVRAIGVDRLARHLALPHRIIGIPHYRPTERFAQHVLQEIEEKTDGALALTPEDTRVVTATPTVAALFEALGFEVLPAPVDDEAVASTLMGTPHESLFESSSTILADFPEVFARAGRLYRDPLLDDSGSITKTRDYDVYVGAMSDPAVVRMKYDDIRAHVRNGRIADEGCADGALLAEIARDFVDSDLIGIEITGEMLALCAERQRRGHFGGTYVHFHQRNLFDEVFEPASIDTTICNSTLHELWSYGDGEPTIRAYLERKYAQTAPGGRLVMRDVVGPEDGDREVLLWALDEDRFKHFATDYVLDVPYERVSHDGRSLFRLSLRNAVEFMAKKDYVANWASEMKEQFAFWSLTDWKAALRRAGFSVLDESHTYTNPWIVENRWRGRVGLYELDGTPIPDPPTTMVLVGQR